MKTPAKYCLLMACLFFHMGCKELYEPNLEIMEPLLTVEGILTDEQKSHQVKIFYTRHYHDDEKAVAVSDAFVMVSDDQGNEFPFFESGKSGYYQSDIFSAVVGRSYKLHIRTPEDLQIESGWQKVMPMADIDSIFGFIGKLNYLVPNFFGEWMMQSYEGIRVFVDIAEASAGIPRIRFEASIMQLFYGPNYPSPYPTGYFWRKTNDIVPPNVNFSEGPTDAASLKNHQLIFVPLGVKRYYGIPDTCDPAGKYLLVRSFSLNQEAYLFYKDVHRQLSAEGRLFDPIMTQITGNIRCTSQPEKKVLGFFEASSSVSKTYSIYGSPMLNLVQIEPYEDLSHMADWGQLSYVPDFWRWR